MEAGEGRWNRGIVFFIILTMAKEGPIYGNQVSSAISEKTDGAWKPSSGSIYPALDRMARRGLLERYKDGGKVMYRITDKGSSLISKIMERRFERSPISKFMGRLWMDTMGSEEKTRFILGSAKNAADSLEENLKAIKEGLENKKEYEVFLMSYELELEKTLDILRKARMELTEIKEVK
ncbi:MAG: PadR family transcriptional regulator [Thermoplasmatales archaeon]